MKLVLIEWLDSHSGRGWQDMEKFEDAAQPLYCRSVGWLAVESDDCKVLVPHLAGNQNGNIVAQGCGDLTIPTQAIVKVEVLRDD